MKTTYFHILILGILLSILTSCGGNATEQTPITSIITFAADTTHLQPGDCATPDAAKTRSIMGNIAFGGFMDLLAFT